MVEITNVGESLSSKAGIIEYLLITGLHGRQDLRLEFAGPATIFLADNGSGKTTALYILHSLLTLQYENLKKFEFEKIIIKFVGAKEFIVNSSAIHLADSKYNRFLKHHSMEPSELRALFAMYEVGGLSELVDSKLFQSVVVRNKLPRSIFQSRLSKLMIDRSYINDSDLFFDNSQLNKVSEFIKNKLNCSIIYLPTYRRVEQNVDMLSESRGERRIDTLIKYGMKDITSKIEEVTSKIKSHFVHTYGQISGQMLGQLAENKEISLENKSKLANRSKIEIVLARVSGNITLSQRESILHSFDNGTLLNNKYLSFFLSQLIVAYDSVEKYDKSLQKYEAVCNKYLINKKMHYDSLNAMLEIREDYNGTDIDLENLSSGEKQLLGVMANLYLNPDEDYIVIFDEPELSLSVDWQRQILVDVYNSGSCKMLVSATHSPFVFENELDSYARSLKLTYCDTPKMRSA